MATAEGYLRRLTCRLTEDPEQRDVEELTDKVACTGAHRAIDRERGQEVTMVGTLRSGGQRQGCAAACAPSCSGRHRRGDARLVGQRRIPGIESGRTLRARPAGQVGERRQGDLQPALRNTQR